MSDEVDSPSPRLVGPVRWFVFGAVVVGAAALAVVGLWVAREERDSLVDGAATVPTVAPNRAAASPLSTGSETLLFRNSALGDAYGRLATVSADDPDGARSIGELSCERVDFRAGVGVCLDADRGFVTSYRALVFDEEFTVEHEIGLAGSPSRVRVSPSGTVAGATVFVTGHSYSDVGFSTQTVLIDTAQGDVIADLEVDFTVRRDGDVIQEVDFNFWGVTFVDDDNFYATLGTGDETYLVRGDIAEREMTVVQPGVECPSLSPSGTHVAFKVRNGPRKWQIAVLDLATSEVTTLAETRNVDDQVAWLDDDTVMYGMPVPDSPAETDTWIVPADGSGQPELYLSRAWSTSITG
jgi:dipeptidyl aminopeptidase/acylaminoacyl peptidase